MSRKVGTIRRFSVTYVEYGDSVDGKARTLGLYKTRESACRNMLKDSMRYYKELGFNEISQFRNSASVGSTDEFGCEWGIEEVSIPVYDDEIEISGRDDHYEAKNRKKTRCIP